MRGDQPGSLPADAPVRTFGACMAGTLYGELEALMGSALPSVDVLELPAPALEVTARSAA